MPMTMTILDIAQFITNTKDLSMNEMASVLNTFDEDDKRNILHFLELTNNIEKESYVKGADDFKEWLTHKWPDLKEYVEKEMAKHA